MRRRKLYRRMVAQQLFPSQPFHDGQQVERAGFTAYQIGGFALAGARHGVPDIDLVRFAEQAAGARDILAASHLPVLVDADDGYGDVKNVTHTVRSYEAMGVSALFIEDQVSPKRCGHLSGKQVVPAESMEQKIRAAAAARHSADLFLVARTGAREPEGLDAALSRAERYLKAGADGIYVEAPKSEKELRKIGETFHGVPQMANMFETSLLFRVVRTLERALEDLRAGKPTPQKEGVSLMEFEQIVGLPEWARIENQFQGSEEKLTRPGA